MQPPLPPQEPSGQAPAFQPRRATDIDVLVGKQIRKIRRRLNIRQVELAQHIGVSFPQVQKYESGENRVTVTTLLRICTALNIRAVDFITLVCADIAARQPIKHPDRPSF